MAVRVALLFLTTGLFTAVWSGDHPDQMAKVDRPSKFLAGQTQVIRPGNDLETERAAAKAGLPGGALSSASNDTQTNIPLPPGIVSGTYLVADQFGRTEIRVVASHPISPEEATSEGTTKDHYLVEDGGLRWHYLRIEHSVADRTAIIPSANSSVR